MEFFVTSAGSMAGILMQGLNTCCIEDALRLSTSTGGLLVVSLGKPPSISWFPEYYYFQGFGAGCVSGIFVAIDFLCLGSGF